MDDTGATDTGGVDTETDSPPPDDTEETATDSETATDTDTGVPWVPRDATVGWDAKVLADSDWTLGPAVVGGGDLSGDGLDDLAVAAKDLAAGYPGEGMAIAVADGGAREVGTVTLSDVADRAVGPLTEVDALGDDAAVGDIDGDGQIDMAVANIYYYEWDTSAYAGAVFVFHGPIVGSVGDESIVATLTTMCPEWPYSYSYCSIGDNLDVGDANGDAYADIALTGLIAEGAYAAAIVAGPAAGDIDIAVDSLALFDDAHAVWLPGDIDGDGVGDTWVCGKSQTDLVMGPVAGVITSGDGDVGFVDAYCVDPAPLVADLDGDGHVDFLVGHQTEDDGAGGRAGAVYVEYGPISGYPSVLDAPVRMAGFGDQTFGTSLACLDDLDGNGHLDLVVGAPDEGATDPTEHGPGAAYLYHGPLGGVSGPDEADQVLAEQDGDDQFGERLANVGDLDGDGLSDLAVTGPGDREGGGYGAVWLYYGASLVP